MGRDQTSDVVIIGGGQAGLAVGYHLAKQHRTLRHPGCRRTRGRCLADAMGRAAPLHAGALQQPAGHAIPRRSAQLPDQGRRRRLPRGVRDEVRTPHPHRRASHRRLAGRCRPRLSDRHRRRGLRRPPRSWSQPAPTTDPASRTSPLTWTRASPSCTRASSGAPRSSAMARSWWSEPATPARRSP